MAIDIASVEDAAEIVRTDPLAPGFELLQRYRIVSRLRRLSHSNLYQAEHLGLGKTVLIRERPGAPGDSSPEPSNGPRREAQLFAAGISSHLLVATDSFLEGGCHYLVMEYSEGETLSERADRQAGPFPEELVLNWAGQLCDLLVELHSQTPPVFVTEIPPESVLIKEDGTLVLLELAPSPEEQQRGRTGTRPLDTGSSIAPTSTIPETGPARDIFALGVCLHYLMSGRSMTGTPSTAIESIRAANPAVSQAAEQLVARCLSTDPGQRFGSARELKAALTPEEAVQRRAVYSTRGRLELPPTPIILEALRPRQWGKNLLLFAGLLFTANLFSPGPLALAFAAFACFCALSSTIYLLNDILDREQDQSHPRKRLRPIASGRMTVRAASQVAIILGIAGLAASFLIRPEFGALALAFLLLNVSYSLWLKHEVILDVLAIAAGFILRALAGAEAIQVDISPWLLVCTALLSLVLGFGKRRQEITSLDAAAAHRRVLQDYNPAFLDQLMSSMTATTIGAYLLYSFQSETAKVHHWIPATIPFVLYGMFRYLYLVHQRNLGGAPEDLVFHDRPLLIAVLGFGVTAAAAMAVR